MFSAVPANLHRWHRHIDEVDVKMDVLLYTKLYRPMQLFQSEQCGKNSPESESSGLTELNKSFSFS